MSASVNISSRGSVLKVLMGSPPVMTIVTQTAGFDGPGAVPTMDDVTTTTSPDNWEETAATTKSPGKITSSLVYNPDDPAQEYLLQSNFSADSPLESFEEWIGPLPSKKLAYKAYVTGFKFGPPIKKQVRVALELTLSGPITFPV